MELIGRDRSKGPERGVGGRGHGRRVSSQGAQAERNLELKARLGSPQAALSACGRLGATDHGVLRQRDTYFAVHRGRLKLREEDGRSELIAYHRPDLGAARESSYRRVPVADSPALSAALGETLGVLAVVAKERRLLVWEGVRIHLDRVEGIGDFVEFEAPLGAGSPRRAAQRLLAVLVDTLGVREEDRVAVGYVDLIREADGPGAGAG